VAIQQISISFDGTVNTNTPVNVQVYRQTSYAGSSSVKVKIYQKSAQVGRAAECGFST